jgi:hypothetical protein
VDSDNHFGWVVALLPACSKNLRGTVSLISVEKKITMDENYFLQQFTKNRHLLDLPKHDP